MEAVFFFCLKCTEAGLKWYHLYLPPLHHFYFCIYGPHFQNFLNPHIQILEKQMHNYLFFVCWMIPLFPHL